MRSWSLAVLPVLALAAAGCQLIPKPQRAVTRLTCPPTEGVLTRVSIAPNGKTCRYRTAHGSQVELRLVPVTDGVQAALSALETETLALAGPKPAAAPASGEAGEVRAQAEADAGAAEETADDDAKDTNDADQDVDIDLPGLHIRAEGEAARIKLGGLQVDAGGSGAVVRKTWDVRLRGEAASPEKRGVRALFIKVDATGDTHSGVGYQVAGPKAGPLTAGLVKWAPGDSEDVYEDVRKLVRDNGGA